MPWLVPDYSQYLRSYGEGNGVLDVEQITKADAGVASAQKQRGGGRRLVPPLASFQTYYI